MIGLVLVTHGRLANEFLAAMEHVVGSQKNIATICIGPDDNIAQCRNEIKSAVETVNVGSGVIILTDMFGGTPSNLAISIMEDVHIEVIAGMNLPMLIKLATERENLTLNDAVIAAQDSGRRYIAVASSLLKQKK